MTIHSLYIYDRHCACVYYQDWHRTRRPKLAVEGGIMPATPVSSASAAMISGPITSTGLSFDEEAKLVYGVILSLRNMVKKLSGRDEQFVNYRTSAYKLHLFETISGYKFVMLSDPNADSLRFVLRQIYVGPFLQYVTRNPLVSMDSKECGIDNEYFRSSVDRLVRGLSIFA
ncbi:Longin-like domain-containing protein [Armillaria borealis]|uniref:Trafficking protein particle complex subunit n=1 Tax=Armillaria borealis TaxID=47425 RepID=A0AA39N1F9_9AGAR|nr:Longin-like domain-containing protein [Armillaria borealis]